MPKNFENFSKRVDIAEGFDVQLIVTNEWDEGFNGDIILSNTSNVPLEAWMLSLDTNFEIADLWGEALVENSSNSYHEIFVLGTDPLKADTDDNGISDGDEDFDNDGLFQIFKNTSMGQIHGMLIRTGMGVIRLCRNIYP